MIAVEITRHITVDEYLAGELISEVKHEYVDGEVYAMAGASRAHITLVGNAYLALRTRLAGTPCTPYFSDLKVRLAIRGKEIFYYPDVVVGCDPRDNDSHSLRFPKFIIEVLSPATSRFDRQEKLLNYATIPSLEEYLLVDQDVAQVTLFRGRSEWMGEVITGLDSVVHLESMDLKITLRQLYEGVPVIGG